MASLTQAVTAKYNLGPVKPWVEQAAYQIGPEFGIKTIYGWRQSDPFPDHPSGHALDFMIPNLATGQALADYVVANYKALGVKYVIFNHRVWNPQQGWHPYTSTSNPHTDHVHVTFNDTPGTGIANLVGYTGGTPATASFDEKTCAWSVTVPLAGNSCLLSNQQARSLLGALIIASGVIVGLTGAVLLVVYGLGKSGAADFLPYGKVLKRLG